MVRHFLGTLFFGFIVFALFVNLYQFSGALMPFEMNGISSQVPASDSIFGFTSIFNFITDLSSSTDIQAAIKCITAGVKVIQWFTIDKVVDVFESATSLVKPTGIDALKLFISFIGVFFWGLLTPFTFLFGAVAILIGVFLFAWQLVAILVRFLYGYYNYVPVSSGMLSAVNFTQSLSYIPIAL